MWRVVVVTVLSGAAALGYLWKTAFGFYRAEHSLGRFCLLDDLVLAAAAVLSWRCFQRSLEETTFRPPSWVWAVAGLGLWLLGTGVVAGVCGGLSVPTVLTYMAQTFWLAGAGIFLWVTWKDRALVSDDPVRRSWPVLAAAALRVGGTLLLLSCFGSTDDPRQAFWSELLCDWPSKMLFFYAFLTSRVEV